MKPVRTWILIADGARARVVANFGPGKGTHEVEGMSLRASHPDAKELLDDRPGRSFNSTNPTRHAMERTSDPKRQIEREFASMLAETIAANENEFDRLILVAAPTALGDLRHALPDRILGRVTHELAKDLTHVPDTKLAQHLSEVIAL